MDDLPDKMWGIILSFLILRERRGVEGTSKQVLRVVRENLCVISDEIEFLFHYHDSAEPDLGSIFSRKVFDNVVRLGIHLACECTPMDLDGWFPRLDTLALYPSKMLFVGLCTKGIEVFPDKKIAISYKYKEGLDLKHVECSEVFTSPPTLKRLLLAKNLVGEEDTEITYHEKSGVELMIMPIKYKQLRRQLIPIEEYKRCHRLGEHEKNVVVFRILSSIIKQVMHKLHTKIMLPRSTNYSWGVWEDFSFGCSVEWDIDEL